MPYQDYTYGYQISPIVKEKTPLMVLAVIVNNHQHHYHSSDKDNTCICQFCLTSHSITSMGHACFVEILQICCIFCLLAGGPLGNGYLRTGARCCLFYTQALLSLSLSAYNIEKKL